MSELLYLRKFNVKKKNPKHLFQMPDGDMLSWLFENEMYSLARFLEKAWKLRKRTLYPELKGPCFM